MEKLESLPAFCNQPDATPPHVLVITNITKFLSLKCHNTSFLPSDSRFQSKYNDNDGATESEEGIE